MLYVFVLVVGACVGSFLNVVVYRLPRRVSVVRPGSHCPACAHPLRWRDMVPALSYLWRRGRCGYCRGRIGVHYAVVEVATALLFCGLVGLFGYTLAALRYIFLGCLLVAAAEIDRRHGIIPNRLLAAGLVGGLLLGVAAVPSEGTAGLLRLLLPAAGSFGILLLVREGSRLMLGRAGLGMGDVKLAGVAALFLGWETLWAFYLAAVLGAVVGLAGRWRGRYGPGATLPFAPFVAAGAVLDVFLLPACRVLPLLGWTL